MDGHDEDLSGLGEDDLEAMNHRRRLMLVLRNLVALAEEDLARSDSTFSEIEVAEFKSQLERVKSGYVSYHQMLDPEYHWVDDSRERERREKAVPPALEDWACCRCCEGGVDRGGNLPDSSRRAVCRVCGAPFAVWVHVNPDDRPMYALSILRAPCGAELVGEEDVEGGWLFPHDSCLDWVVFPEPDRPGHSWALMWNEDTDACRGCGRITCYCKFCKVWFHLDGVTRCRLHGPRCRCR